MTASTATTEVASVDPLDSSLCLLGHRLTNAEHKEVIDVQPIVKLLLNLLIIIANILATILVTDFVLINVLVALARNIAIVLRVQLRVAGRIIALLSPEYLDFLKC
jgi:hypothetical protein